MLHFGPGALAAAFAAGFVSFVSPCVLPLIPGYLSFVSGVGFDQLGANQRRVVTTTAAFVLGFGAMFTALGAGAGLFGNVLLENRRPLEIVAGSFIALAGLVYAGLPLPRTLLSERRLHVRGERGSTLTAVGTGLAFAVGWTPCLGPTLAAILTLAAAGGHPGQGAVLLAVFALAFTRALALVRMVRRHWRAVSLVSGAMLVIFGVLLATGDLIRLTTQLSRFTGLS